MSPLAALAIRAVSRHLKDTRGVSLYEITAAVAMTGILAAVAVPVIIEQTTEAKAARVTQEVDAISQAVNAFKRDTGKTPGEAEGTSLLLSGPSGMHALLPNGAAAAFNVPGASMDDSSHTCSSGCANMNDYLVRDPNLVFPSTNGSLKYPRLEGAVHRRDLHRPVRPFLHGERGAHVQAGDASPAGQLRLRLGDLGWS